MLHACFYAYKYKLTSARLDMAVDVTKSKLETMCKDGEMTSTWMMKLFTMWMEYSLPSEMTEQFTIVDPFWVHQHKQAAKGQDILRKVVERDFIFIPIVVQGHWVLWTKMWHKVSKLTNATIFCDTLNNATIDTVRSLTDIAIQTISTEPSDHAIML